MPAMPIRWKLRPLLERHGVSAYRLVKESGLAPATVYAIARGETRNLNADTVDRLLSALHRLIGTEIQLGDLVVYEPKVMHLVSRHRDVRDALMATTVDQSIDELRGRLLEADPAAAADEQLRAWVATGTAFEDEDSAKHAAADQAGRWYVHPIGASDVMALWAELEALPASDASA